MWAGGRGGGRAGGQRAACTLPHATPSRLADSRPTPQPTPPFPTHPQSDRFHDLSNDYINATGTFQFDDTGAANVNFNAGMEPATQALFLSCVSANSPCFDYQQVRLNT